MTLFLYVCAPFYLLLMKKNVPLLSLLFVLLATASFAQVPEVDMVFVQGGEFVMGCTREQHDDCMYNEMPTHLVVMDDFYISKYEVTQALWKAVMGNNPSRVKGDSLPVTCVSWLDATSFIYRLNKLTGKKYRLPTEAEWEYAARGGAYSQGYKFSGSDNLEEVAWYRKNSKRQPHPVGLLQPNELGVYDMSGNVYEWCYDGFGFYEADWAGNMPDPLGNNLISRKVYRGGCMTSFWERCRVSSRNADDQILTTHFIGFRLAMDVEQ